MAEIYNVYAYANAQLLVQVLKQCGDDLTRENVMKQAANLKNFELPMLLPGVRINTSATDYDPIEQLQLMRFDGKEWVRFGEVIGRERIHLTGFRGRPRPLAQRCRPETIARPTRRSRRRIGRP